MEMKQKVLEKQQQEAASPSSPMVQAGSPVSPSKPAHEEEEQDMGRRGGEEEAHDLGSQTPPMRRYPAAVPPPPDNEEPTSPVLPMRPADAQLVRTGEMPQGTSFMLKTFGESNNPSLYLLS